MHLDVLGVRSVNLHLLQSLHLREPVFPVYGCRRHIGDSLEPFRLCQQVPDRVAPESVAHHQQMPFVYDQVHPFIWLVSERSEGAAYLRKAVVGGHDLDTGMIGHVSRDIRSEVIGRLSLGTWTPLLFTNPQKGCYVLIGFVLLRAIHIFRPIKVKYLPTFWLIAGVKCRQCPAVEDIDRNSGCFCCQRPELMDIENSRDCNVSISFVLIASNAYL